MTIPAYNWGANLPLTTGPNGTLYVAFGQQVQSPGNASFTPFGVYSPIAFQLRPGSPLGIVYDGYGNAITVLL